MSDHVPTIRFSSVTIDCPNAEKLACFYATITGGEVSFPFSDHSAWASVATPGGRIDFQTIPNHTPPAWPAGPIQMHLDFYVDDLQAGEARALAAGATKFDFQPNRDHCLTFADPVGHPFCLTTWE